MKSWQAAVAIILAISLLSLTACDFLGLGSKKTKEQEYYERQIEALQKQLEADQKAQEEYNEYYRQVQESIKQQLEGMQQPQSVTTTTLTGGQ